MGASILLVEDDPELGRQIATELESQGHAVTWWREGRPIDADLARSLQLVILDLMLPGSYGLDILDDLRRTSDVPVLILSARQDARDKVRAFELGADDYLTKPFWPRELVERVRARLRRPTMQRHDVVEHGVLRIDAVHRRVWSGDREAELTRVEFELLLALARRGGEPVSRRALVDAALDPEREGNERTLDVHVSRLRRKLGDSVPIATVWGIGYRLGQASDR